MDCLNLFPIPSRLADGVIDVLWFDVLSLGGKDAAPDGEDGGGGATAPLSGGDGGGARARFEDILSKVGSIMKSTYWLTLCTQLRNV